MIIDSSALVAILTSEEDAVAFTKKIESSDYRVTTPSCVWETCVNVSRKLNVSVPQAIDNVMDLFDLLNIKIVAIPAKASFISVTAFQVYGKGRHPAALNFGDCLSYASAKVLNQPLLFKGNDFALTDVAAI